MKGILLAGGTGSRLHPMTLAVSKQLLPVYDKPLIFYPLSTLMLAGIKEILLITTPTDLPSFQRLLGDGSQWGLKLHYAPQPRPEGLPQAFLIGSDFIGSDSVALILGDNLFYGQGFRDLLRRATEQTVGATIFGYEVRDVRRYGVVQFDNHGQVLSIEEKPSQPQSSHAITGLYFFDNQVIRIAQRLTPSARGELEITDIIRRYHQQNQLHLQLLSRGFAWLDTGTRDSLLDASNFVAAIEKRQGLKISCPEEIAYRLGYIDTRQLRQLGQALSNEYGQYLLRLCDTPPSRTG